MLDYLQRLQRGMVELKLQEEKVNDNDLAKIPTRMSNCFLPTNPEGNSPMEC
jgi:hypothetical protein